MMLLRIVVFLFFALGAMAQQSLDRAWNLAANGQREAAIQLLHQLIGSDSKDADARLLLGSLLMEAGYETESIRQLSAAAQLRPRSEVAQNALGEAYLHFGENEKAHAAFAQAIALKPGYGIAQLNLGQVLLGANDTIGAEQHLDRAITLLGNTDDAADAYYLRAKIDALQNKPQQAVDRLQKATAIRPGFAEAWSDLGQARKLLFDDSGALAAFEHAVACNPKDAVAQYRLGAEYLHQGKPGPAVEHLQKAYALNPQDQSTLNALQMAFRQSGDPAAANRVKQQLADLLRQRDQMNQNKLAAVKLNNDGANLEKSGDLRGALEKYREAARLDPQHAGILTNYGLVLLRLGQWKEGLEELHTARLRDPKNERLKAVLQDALAQAPKDAIPQWGRDLR